MPLLHGADERGGRARQKNGASADGKADGAMRDLRQRLIDIAKSAENKRAEPPRAPEPTEGFFCREASFRAAHWGISTGLRLKTCAPAIRILRGIAGARSGCCFWIRKRRGSAAARERLPLKLAWDGLNRAAWSFANTSCEITHRRRTSSAKSLHCRKGGYAVTV